MEKEKNSKNIMDYATVTLLEAENAIEIIDQTKLPGTIELIRLKSAQEIWNAIYLLKVRGAPAIGVAAGFGIYLLAKEIETEDYEVFSETERIFEFFPPDRSQSLLGIKPDGESLYCK